MKLNSLKFKLLVLLLGIVIFSNVVLGFIAYTMAKSSLGNSVENQIIAISENAANLIRENNEKEFHMLDVLANMSVIQDPSVSNQEKTEIVSSAKKINTNYENISYYDENGISITTDGSVIDFSNREYFKRAIKGEHYISDPTISPVNNKLLIFYSVPVRDLYSGRITGAIVAITHGDAPSKLCKDITIGSSSHPFVINMKTGKTVADSDVKFVEEGQVLRDSTSGAMKEAITDTMKGTVAYKVFFEPWRKKLMVASYRPVGGNCDWAVFCMAPFSEFFGVITKMATSMLIAIAIILIIAVTISTLIISMSIKPLKTVEASITEIASGNADLTKRIAVTSNDEIGNVVKGFNAFTEKLQQIISAVKDSKSNLGSVGETMSASVGDTAASITEIISNIDSMRKQISGQTQSVNQTAGAVNQIASNIESLENMIAAQSRGVSAASAAVEEMIGNISSVNGSVDKMARSFNDLRMNAHTGIEKQKAVNARVEQIEAQSQMLQEANGAISAIASQTNLLAMNAAIEAAHAGEAGKGFAVVADEIRKLSETSTAQSKTIGVQLTNIKDSINEVVEASSDASIAFETVSLKLEETDALVLHIKTAMEEQNEGSKQITEALHNMNDSTGEVRTASSEMAEGNKMILKEVQLLQDATVSMTQGMDEMSIGAKKINETGSALHGIAGKMNESIAEIGEQIDQFKV
ncbi:methyl-accepting chemotaxis protein [Treponema sp. C6A8]|uniref:methyl-accepting chemotaxis protein n=1 Tax=Treponema sp. C6A8 TaxID=1410609 RepID=UPI000487AF21|nr:methyl-accepting chemotaxis protein [Treponema sp. C6A8]